MCHKAFLIKGKLVYYKLGLSFVVWAIGSAVYDNNAITRDLHDE